MLWTRKPQISLFLVEFCRNRGASQLENLNIVTEKSLLSRLSTHLKRPPGNPCQDYTISSSGGDDDYREDGS